MHFWAKYDHSTDAVLDADSLKQAYFKTIGQFDYAESQEMNSGDDDY